MEQLLDRYQSDLEAGAVLTVGTEWVRDKLKKTLQEIRYRAKLVLGRYIPKLNGKLRPLGIPAIADKVLQMRVTKILEEIYEQDFLGCSYGYRPNVGALDAVRDLSAELRSGCYHVLVEADIRSFFDFEFLGFEFRWGRGRWGKPAIKRRTARKKYRAALASFQKWCREHCRMRKEKFFAALNAKLRGYYNYYGIRGNFDSMDDFFYQVTRMLYRQLNRRSQRRSDNWQGFAEPIKVFKLQSPRICRSF